MPKQPSLHRAKKEKNDEFYTQYQDIEKEMNAYLEYNPDVFKDKIIFLPCDDPEWSNFTKYFAQNFENFGIKKLISTSYAANSKPKEIPYQPTLFEIESPRFDKKKTRSHGKIFILERDTNKDKKININDLEWDYLKDDGDFRSSEIKKIRNEADIIITNPPFSLFREFLAWIHDAKKQFAILGGQNAITYKEVFPLIKNGEVWLGATYSTKMYFAVPSETHRVGSESIGGKNMQFLGNIRWYTNIDHGRRHQPLALMTMSDNLKFSKHKEIRENGYQKYDNYDAIEVPFTDAIPSDYRENMGVPISFLDKHDPSQFEIIKFRKGKDGKDLTYTLSDDGGIERERTQGHAILQNHHQKEGGVTASWESQSHSLTSITQTNSKSLATNTTSISQEEEGMSMENECSQEYSLNIRCSGVMGVPISFLDKYCPEQFSIIGHTHSGDRSKEVNLLRTNPKMRHRGYIQGKQVYDRILIKHKEQP